MDGWGWVFESRPGLVVSLCARNTKLLFAEEADWIGMVDVGNGEVQGLRLVIRETFTVTVDGLREGWWGRHYCTGAVAWGRDGSRRRTGLPWFLLF